MLPNRRAKQKCLEATNRRKRSRANSSWQLETSFDKDKQTDCAICLETVTVRGKLGTCNHWFCFQCIYEWSKMTNICPLCKLRFRCITKINLKPWASPAKAFRIKDRDQKLDHTAEDLEMAMELENEVSFDDNNDPDYLEDSSNGDNSITNDMDDFDYEDSFIDDTDQVEEHSDFSLRTYLQRVDRLTNCPYALRRSINGTIQRSRPMNSGRYQTRLRGRLDSPLSVNEDSIPGNTENEQRAINENDNQTSAVQRRRRKRRHKLTCPVQGRRSRNATTSSTTVSGWINMANKQSNASRNFPTNSDDNLSSEDSDDSENDVPAQRRRSKNRKMISSDEEFLDKADSIKEMDLVDDDMSSGRQSPSVVSSQSSQDTRGITSEKDEIQNRYQLRTRQSADCFLESREYSRGFSRRKEAEDGSSQPCKNLSPIIDCRKPRRSISRPDYSEFFTYDEGTNEDADYKPENEYLIWRQKKTEDRYYENQEMKSSRKSNEHLHRARFNPDINTSSSITSSSLDARKIPTLIYNDREHKDECHRQYRFKKTTLSRELLRKTDNAGDQQYCDEMESININALPSSSTFTGTERHKPSFNNFKKTANSNISGISDCEFSAGLDNSIRKGCFSSETKKNGLDSSEPCSLEEERSENNPRCLRQHVARKEDFETKDADEEERPHIRFKEERGWGNRANDVEHDQRMDTQRTKQEATLTRSVKILNESTVRKPSYLSSYSRDMSSVNNQTKTEISSSSSNQDKENFEADQDDVSIFASTPQGKPKFRSILRRKRSIHPSNKLEEYY